MKVQITNYGVEQMQLTGQPLNVSKYVLGSGYGYTPKQDATGITGEELYSSTPTELEIVNANVYKYQIGLDYNVGNFSFGEVALYDSTNQCVAVGVSEDLISKIKVNGNSGGNSVVLGIYLSMVAENYAMWIDALASDNQYAVPILESIDGLGPASEAYPNFYIIKGASTQQSSVLAYTSKDGLWYFDAYSYQNQITLTVSNSTSTTVQFKTTGIDSDKLADIIVLRYFGDKVIEFTSGQVYSICRNVKSITVVGTTATIAYATPITILPQVGDTFIMFSRTQMTTTNVNVPVATENTLGGISIGEGLNIDAVGKVSVQVTRDQVNSALEPFNESGSVLKLSETGDEQIAGKDGAEFSGARVPVRNMAYGALYFAGSWNAETNVVNNIQGQSLKPNGLFSIASEDGADTKEWSPKGWLFTVSASGTTELDGYSEWQEGDIICCDGSKWYLIYTNYHKFMPMPDGFGFIMKDESGNIKAVTIEADDSGILVNQSGNKLSLGLSTTGVTAGSYGDFITVDEYGRISIATDHISAGTF